MELPKSLKSLTFGSLFNQSLEAVILPDLDVLTLGFCFNQSSLGWCFLYLSRFVHWFLAHPSSFDSTLAQVAPPTSTRAWGAANLSPKRIHLHKSISNCTWCRVVKRKIARATVFLARRVEVWSAQICLAAFVPWPLAGTSTRTCSVCSCGSTSGRCETLVLFLALKSIHMNGTLQSFNIRPGVFYINGFSMIFPSFVPSILALNISNFPLIFHGFPGLFPRRPADLEVLSFAGKFNRSLVGVDFPKGLRSLTFGEMFNQSSWAAEGDEHPATISFELQGTRVSKAIHQQHAGETTCPRQRPTKA